MEMENNSIIIYKHDMFDFLERINRLDKLIPKNIMDEISLNKYRISGRIGHAIDILENRGAQIIKTLHLGELQFDNISFNIISSGWARCGKCRSHEIMCKDIPPDKVTWSCKHCDWNTTHIKR